MTDLSQRSDEPPDRAEHAFPATVDAEQTWPDPGEQPRADRCDGSDVPEVARPYGTLAGRASLFVVGTGLALVAAHAVSIPTPPCPLRTATGFPCPFCGCTHIARELLSGGVAEVARHDPAGLVFAALVGVAVIAQLMAISRRIRGPAFMTSRVAGIGVLGVLAAHWATTIVTGGMLST
ncbi:MAG TPA: DUF2752 domain-containing protein [Acidimicrobiales bacterium]|nr:DUF2752 domain-containing protein [Acidimicrobiales bacterium]